MRFFVVVTSVACALAGCGRTPLNNCPAEGCASEASSGGGGDRAGAGGAGGSGGSAGNGGVTISGGNLAGAAPAGAPGSSGGVSGGCTVGGGGFPLTCTFHEGRAVSGLEGSGWVALGEKDSVSAPTCGGQPITSDRVCSAYSWPTEFGLCVSGLIPALPAMPLQSDYDINWGIMFGTTVSNIEGCNLAGSYKTVRFDLSGSPQPNLRAVVHLHRDADQTMYCASLDPKEGIPFTAFNTKCWDGSGTQLTQDDVSEIDKIGIHIVSGSNEVQIPKFCLGAIFLQE